jgi:hypothetical protein
VLRRLIVVVFLCMAAAPVLAGQDWDADRRWRHRDGLQIRVGRSYHLPADQIASWPIVVVGGSATIDGRVEDDIVVIGGPVTIGPSAQVRANVVALGGEVKVADSAQVSGEIHDVSVLWPEIRFALRDWLWGIDRGWWPVFELTATVFRYVLTIIAACLMALLAPAWVRRIEDRVSDAPLAAAFVGDASEMLALPVFVIVIAGLVVTIIGIPLLILVPFAVLALLATWLAGFASVAAFLGSRLRGRARPFGAAPSVIDVAWGVTLLFVLPIASDILAFGSFFTWPLSTSLGVAGFVFEYLAWTIGLGAALLAPLRRRWEVGPPPVPSAASANA